MRPAAMSRWVQATCVIAALLAAGCRRAPQSTGTEKAEAVTPKKSGAATIVLAAYTAPREAYGKSILPAFQKDWKQKTGQDVEFQESYQASGAQARAIVGGFAADVVALSLEADVDKIAAEKLISHDWRAKLHGGMVTTSIVVLLVREGNPKGIRDWADLAQPGLEVLTPDPRTSGGAQWNVNAVYGAALRGHAGVAAGDADAAEEFLKSVFRNVTIMDKGARESITTFEKGVGDVAITYENEAIVGRQSGERYEIVVPTSTILIENPVALVDASVDAHGTREVTEAFVDFLWSPEAQRGYAAHGLRPVEPSVAEEVASQFAQVQDLWTIADLGGWPKVTEEIYGPSGAWSRVFDEKSSRQ